MPSLAFIPTLVAIGALVWLWIIATGASRGVRLAVTLLAVPGIFLHVAAPFAHASLVGLILECAAGIIALIYSRVA